MSSTSSAIVVHSLSNKPTKLWDKLKVKQKQKKLDIGTFITPNLQEPGTVRFVFISDTHNQTEALELPDGDVLIHAGDFTNVGKPGEIDHFNEFLGKIKSQYKHIIVISGNHELTFDPVGAESASMYLPSNCMNLDHKDMKSKLTNCTYIEDETIEVMGFKIYGSPWCV